MHLIHNTNNDSLFLFMMQRMKRCSGPTGKPETLINRMSSIPYESKAEKSLYILLYRYGVIIEAWMNKMLVSWWIHYHTYPTWIFFRQLNELAIIRINVSFTFLLRFFIFSYNVCTNYYNIQHYFTIVVLTMLCSNKNVKKIGFSSILSNHPI